MAGALAGVVLMSGLYNLEPVRHSYVNQALRLNTNAVRRNSPCLWLPPVYPP